MTPDGRARPADALGAAAVGGVSAIPPGAAAVTDCPGSSLPAGWVAATADVPADAESPDASRAEARAPAAALRNADGPSEAGLVVADFALLRDRFPVGDCDAVRVFAGASLFVPAIRPGDVAAAAEDGDPSDAGPDSAPSAAAVPGLAAIAKPTPTANIADPTREPKFDEFTLPPVVIQHANDVAAT